MLSLDPRTQPPINCSSPNLVFNARPGMDNPSTALSDFLVSYNVSPTTAIPLLGILNGTIIGPNIVFVGTQKRRFNT